MRIASFICYLSIFLGLQTQKLTTNQELKQSLNLSNSCRLCQNYALNMSDSITCTHSLGVPIYASINHFCNLSPSHINKSVIRVKFVDIHCERKPPMSQRLRWLRNKISMYARVQGTHPCVKLTHKLTVQQHITKSYSAVVNEAGVGLYIGTMYYLSLPSQGLPPLIELIYRLASEASPPPYEMSIPRSVCV